MVPERAVTDLAFLIGLHSIREVGDHHPAPHVLQNVLHPVSIAAGGLLDVAHQAAVHDPDAPVTAALVRLLVPDDSLPEAVQHADGLARRVERVDAAQDVRQPA